MNQRAVRGRVLRQNGRANADATYLFRQIRSILGSTVPAGGRRCQLRLLHLRLKV